MNIEKLDRVYEHYGQNITANVPQIKSELAVAQPGEALSQKEAFLAKSVLESKNGVPMRLDREGLDFVYNLGPFSMLQVILQAENGASVLAYATVTPDTKNRNLQLAYLGTKLGQGIRVPDNVNPIYAMQGRLTVVDKDQGRDRADGLPKDAYMYLSAVNQLSLTGDHHAASVITPLEPRHNLTAMAKYFYTESSMPATEVFNPKGVSEAEKDHIGDALEDRRSKGGGLLPVMGATRPEDIAASLVNVPYTFLPAYPIDQINGVGNVAVLFHRSLCEEQALVKGKVVPRRAADNEQGLGQLMRGGYVKLAQKGGENEFLGNVDRRMNELAREGSL